LTAWNPCQINEMALPPCHMICQFHVRQNKYLSCAMLQRSGDIGLGIPFNVASYSLFTHILAKHCGLEADEFTHFIGNAHIYEQHIDALKNQITRKPLEFPKINIKAKYDKIEEYSINDIEWIKKYESDGSIKMEMIA
jgi:thymidylate synthase